METIEKLLRETKTRNEYEAMTSTEPYALQSDEKSYRSGEFILDTRIGISYRVPRGSDEEIHQQKKKQAIGMLKRRLYGDVLDELYKIRQTAEIETSLKISDLIVKLSS